MLTVKDIVSRFDKAMSEKEIWNSIYQSVFRMTMPNRDSFYMDENIPNNWENTQLLTNVGCEAADIFAARFQRIICSDEHTSINISAPEYWEDTPKQRQFDANVSASINRLIVNNLGEYLESAYDLVAGTTVAFRSFDTVNRKFYRVPVPIKDVALTKSFTGQTDGYYRKLKIIREQIPVVFSEVGNRDIDGVPTTPENATESLDLKECTVFNYDDQLWHYYVICGEDLLVNRTAKRCDFCSAFWTRRPGTVYGVGVGMKALPELNQLNALRYYATFGLMFRAAPVWLANENHMLDYDKLQMKPMEIIPVPNTGKDSPSLTPLTVGDDPNVAQWNQSQMEMNIKAVMLSDTIPNQVNKEMTATEIAARTARLNVVNNNMVAVASAMLRDDVQWLLWKFKDIAGFYPPEFDVERYIDGVQISLASTEVKNHEQIQSIATMIDMFNVATPDGSLVSTALNIPEYANKIADLLRVPNSMVLPSEIIAQNMQQRANQQVELETTKQKAELAREILAAAAKNNMQSQAQQVS